MRAELERQYQLPTTMSKRGRVQMEVNAAIDAQKKPETKSQNALPGSYAWRRYFARAFDLSIVMGLIFFAMMMVSIVVVAITDRNELQAYIASVRGFGNINRFLDAIMTALLWLPIEALLLCLFGATPGKWIFGLQVRTQEGGLLGFKSAISRSGLVLIVGQAITLPFISLITLFVSYDRLVKTGSAYWDKELGTTVHYAKLSEGRLVLCFIAAAMWGIVALWSTARYLLVR